jgi:hypothetical protein
MALVGAGGSAGGGISADTERTVILAPGTHKISRTANLVYKPKPCSKDEGTIRLATGTAFAESSGDQFVQTLVQATDNPDDWYSTFTMTGTPAVTNPAYSAARDLMWYNVPKDTVWHMKNMGYKQISSLASSMLAWVWVLKDFGGSPEIIESGPGSDVGTISTFWSNGGYARDFIRFNMYSSTQEAPVYVTEDAGMINHIRGPANIVISANDDWANQDSVDKFWISVEEIPLTAGSVTIQVPGKAPVTLGVGSSFTTTDLQTKVTYSSSVSGRYELQTSY